MAKLFNHRDYITGRRLIKGFNVHHLKTEQDSETYCDISHDEEFIPLNSYCHKMLHYLFTHYRKDNTVIDRLVEILDRMCELMPENSDGVIDDNVDEYDEEEDGKLLEEEEDGQEDSTVSELPYEGASYMPEPPTTTDEVPQGNS